MGNKRQEYISSLHHKGSCHMGPFTDEREATSVFNMLINYLEKKVYYRIKIADDNNSAQ